MDLKVKLLPNAAGLPLPFYQTPGAAGMDLVASSGVDLQSGETALVPTGLSMAVPDGYELQIRSRSGLASKGIFVTNGPGTIDSDYRGEIKVILTNLSGLPFFVPRGMRVAQAVLAPVVRANLIVVDSLPVTDRGDGGFGSTGADT